MNIDLNWSSAVEDIGPRLFRYFCVRFKEEQSDDLTQETLLRLVRKVNEGKFDPKKGSLRMLAFGIAHYVALESKHLTAHDDITDWEHLLASPEDIESCAVDRDTALKVRQQMKNLTSLEQEVLALFVDEEITMKEISKITQMPVGTIKSHIFRAKKKLIKLVSKDDA